MFMCRLLFLPTAVYLLYCSETYLSKTSYFYEITYAPIYILAICALVFIATRLCPAEKAAGSRRVRHMESHARQQYFRQRTMGFSLHRP